MGIDYQQTSADREFTLAPVFCLGNCACGPSIRVGSAVYGRMTAQKFDQLAARLTTRVIDLQ
ncbi:MAG TPA: NAD(P)H-dependent oxidoreductase subunit E [Thiopseudomonas sp.]|nr:NAD(P)H-dependent oxidoreductase subunit E [Thiopseudomonas sp.]